MPEPVTLPDPAPPSADTVSVFGAGPVPTSALPWESTATHSDSEAQDTPVSAVVPLMFVSVQVASAPSVGSVVAAALPASSTATQNETDGHDTSWNPPGPATCSGALQVVGSAGSVELRTFPTSSTATHSDVDGHETRTRHVAPRQFSGGSTLVVDQLAASVGSVDVSTFPLSSTATQSVAGDRTHEMSWTMLPGSVPDSTVHVAE